MSFLGVHHVALPFSGTPDAAEAARQFYGTLLGLTELDVPDSISGVLWFDAGAGTELHLYTDPDAGPGATRHPCLRVSGLASLRESVRAAGVPLIEPPDDIPGRQRFFVIDPFGNALEFAAFG